MNKIKLALVIALSISFMSLNSTKVIADTSKETVCTGAYGQVVDCEKVLGTSTDEVVYLADTALDSKMNLVMAGLIAAGAVAFVAKKKLA